MKRIGHIVDSITLESLCAAAYAAHAARRNRSAAADYFVEHIDTLGEDLLEDILNAEWHPAPVRRRTLIEHGKERLLEIPDFRDVVAQRTLLAGRLERALINHTDRNSFSSIPGRGPLKAAKTVERIVARGKSARWALYFDVRKYYAHINTDILRGQLRRIVKDPKALTLLDRVVGMGSVGLPIGNTSSHLFANLYLTPVIRLARTLPGVTDIVVYMDNVHIFGPSKRKLHAARRRLVAALGERGLEMKDDWQVFRTDLRPVNVCGFLIRAGAPIRVRKTIIAHLRRSLHTFRTARPGSKERRHAAASALSLQGWVLSAGARSFYEKHLHPILRKLKQEVKAK